MDTEEMLKMDSDHEYDLLTAALLGAAVGAAAAFMLGYSVRGAQKTPTQRAIHRGRRWAQQRRAAVSSALDPVEVRDQVGDAFASARDAISDAVDGELKDFRKAMRRKRRSLGI